LEAGIQGLRINPGNIKYQDKVRLIAREAKARGVPIRIGVNAGSLEKDLLEKYGRPTPEALVESALNEARILEDEDFFDIKISVKHSNARVMIEAYRQLSEKCDYPLHLGVTEAGPMPLGGVKSAVGIGTLLAEGIGDTIRVSLTDDPVEEVKVGTSILQSLGLRRRGLDLGACPSCGRCAVCPSNEVWSLDGSRRPVATKSKAWKRSASAGSTLLHPDFGGPPYGFPFDVVAGDHPKVPVSFTYAGESDPGPYPFDAST